MHQYNSGWMNINYNDGAWSKAQQIFKGLPKGVFSWSDGWMLVPRSIPPTELTVQRLNKVRKADNLQPPSSFPQNKTSFMVPAHTNATLLFDQTFLTNAYPSIIFSGGNNANITLGYAEALYLNESDKKDWRTQHQKGNRNETESKRFVGKEDKIISNGEQQQEYTSLWWRTYRYLQLKIETKDEPMVIDDLYGTATGYPFKLNSKFYTEDSSLLKILETGW